MLRRWGKTMTRRLFGIVALSSAIHVCACMAAEPSPLDGNAKYNTAADSFGPFSEDTLGRAVSGDDLSERLAAIRASALRTFVGEGNVRVGYLTLHEPRGNRGTVVVAAGRAESSMKFIELGYDLLRMGFRTVYLLDQRGQGFSDRLIAGAENHDKVHIDSMDFVVNDFQTFVDTIVTQEATGPYYLIANITAGLTATLYLQQNPVQPFSRVILPSPLYELNVTCLEELLFRLQGWWYAPTEWALSDEQQYAPSPFEENDRTTSRARYAFADLVVRTFPEASSFGSTMGWGIEILNAQDRALDSGTAITVPTLMLTASEDELIDNQAVVETCAENFSSCEHVELESARHWILFERDPVRDRALQLITEFLHE